MGVPEKSFSAVVETAVKIWRSCCMWGWEQTEDGGMGGWMGWWVHGLVGA